MLLQRTSLDLPTARAHHRRRSGQDGGPLAVSFGFVEPPEPRQRHVRRHRLRAIAYASFLLVGWSALLVPALIRSVEHDFAQTDAGLGLFYLVSAVCYAGGSFGGGFTTERIGRRPVLAVAALLLAGGLLVEGSARAWWLFVVAAAPANVGAGVVDGGMNALVLDMSGGRPGGALNLLHLFFSLGAAGSPLVVGQLVTLGVDWRVIIVATAAPGVVIGMLLAAHTMPSGRHMRADNAATGGAAASGGMGRSALPLLALACAIGLYVAAEIGVSSWVVRFLAAAPTEAATTTLAAFWGGLALSRLVAARVADRFPPIAFAATCVVAAAVALFGAVVVPWIGLSMVLFAATGLAFGPVYPMIMSIGGTLYPRRLAAVTGGLAGAAVVGGIVYPPVMGVISDAAGVGLAMSGAAFLAVACAAAIIAAGRATAVQAEVTSRDG